MNTVNERHRVGLLLLAALLLQALFLARQNFFLLESDMISLALQPVRNILYDNFPDQSPLFCICVHFWAAIFGVGEFSIRFLNLLFSLVAVYYCYKLGKLFFTPRIGCVAALLLVLLPECYLYVRINRIYSLFLAGATASAFFAIRYIEERRARDLIWYALFCLVTIYTHFFGFATTGLTGLYLVVMTAREWRRHLTVVIGVASAIAVGSLWQIFRIPALIKFVTKDFQGRLTAKFPSFFFGINDELFWGNPADWRLIERFGWSKGWEAAWQSTVVEWLLWLPVLGLTIYGMRLAARRHALFGTIYIFLSQIVLFLAASRLDVRSRYMMFILPASLIFMVAACERLILSRESWWRRGLVTLVAGSMLFISAVGVVDTNTIVPPNEDANLMRYIASIYQPGDIIYASDCDYQLRTPVPLLCHGGLEGIRANLGESNRAILITYKMFVEKMKPTLNLLGRIYEIKEFENKAVIVYWSLPDPSPVLGQMEARLQAGRMAGADILIGGSISAEAQPFKDDGLLNSVLKRQIPFVASLEPGKDPAKQTEAAIKAGVNYLAIIGSDKNPIQSDEITALQWPTKESLIGTLTQTRTQPVVGLLPLDLSELENQSLPEQVMVALREARDRGPVVTLVRWPKRADDGNLELVKALAGQLVEAGASAVVGMDNAEYGPVWRQAEAVVAPWLGSLIAAPSVKKAYGLILHLKVKPDGTIDSATVPILSSENGIDPAGLTLQKNSLDPDSTNDLIFDFGAELRRATKDQNFALVFESSEKGRQVIRAQMPQEERLELTYPSARLGKELRGFFGLSDDAFQDPQQKREQREIEVLVDGKSIGKARGGEEPGWHHFRFDTSPWADRLARVTFLLRGKNDFPFWFNARSVNPRPVSEITGSRMPEQIMGTETPAQVQIMKAAEEAAREEFTSAPHFLNPKIPPTKKLSYGPFHYRAPYFEPARGGFGVLADPLWKEKVELSKRPAVPLPETPTGAYRLRDHLAEAVVEFRPYDGGREVCSRWSEREFYLDEEEFGPQGEGQFQGHWRCGNPAWMSVSQTRQKAGGELRDAVWIHPRDNGVVQVTYPQVPLGGRLEGYFGLTDLVLDKNDFPVYVELLIGGQLVLREKIAGQQKGWKPFNIDTAAWNGQKVDIAIRVETDKQRWRHFCLDAMTR